MSVARFIALAFGVLVLVIMAPPASAQNSRPSPPPGALRAGDQLAKAQDALRVRLRQLSPSALEPLARKPQVVCGMMVMRADPTIDAAIRHSVPKPDDVKFTLRMVEPPACRP